MSDAITTDSDSDAEATLVRGIKAWWHRLALPVRIVVAAVPLLLTIGGAGYAVLAVRADVTRTEAVTVGHELRLQAVERMQAARTAAEAERLKAADALERKVDALATGQRKIADEQSRQGGKLDIIIDTMRRDR